MANTKDIDEKKQAARNRRTRFRNNKMSDTTCVFCQIANRQLNAHKIYEDDYVVAFLDAHPSTKGHTLVIPKEHFDNMAMCPKDILDRLIETCQLIAQAQIANLGATGVNILTNIGKSAGQTINHFHFHVIPRFENDGLLLTFPQNDMNDDDLEQVAQSITPKTPKTVKAKVTTHEQAIVTKVTPTIKQPTSKKTRPQEIKVEAQEVDESQEILETKNE